MIIGLLLSSCGPCETCDDMKQIDCTNCGGSGIISGENTCRKCFGDGKITTVSDMLGEEQVSAFGQSLPLYEYDCPECDGTGYEQVECDVCLGSGKITCPDCE